MLNFQQLAVPSEVADYDMGTQRGSPCNEHDPGVVLLSFSLKSQIVRVKTRSQV